MPPLKLVIKCGNVAVLVDLHVLPLGAQEDTSWFTAEHVEEATALVQGAVECRVRQHAETLHSRGQSRPRKELAPAVAFRATGTCFDLVAHFSKRHFNLRCVVTHRYGELRVFPERYVVCVSCPEDASARHGNPSQAVTGASEQSCSEYFSRVGVTQEPLNCSTKTKRAALQKIARHVDVREDVSGVGKCGSVDTGASDGGRGERPGTGDPDSVPRGEVTGPAGEEVSLPERRPRLTCSADLQVPVEKRKKKNGPARGQKADGERPGTESPRTAATAGSAQRTPRRESRRSGRCEANGAGGALRTPSAKRSRLGGSPGVPARETSAQNLAITGSSQTSRRDRRPPPSPPLPPVEAKAASTASPVPERGETTLEAELLTPGKQPPRPPLTSNNTEQTNQNRLAASLRGLSVKPASSGSAISSRSTLGEEGREHLPRTSRLRRRLKRS